MSRGSNKSEKKPSDGRGISDYMFIQVKLTLGLYIKSVIYRILVDSEFSVNMFNCIQGSRLTIY
jgi:hypothetical protein